MSQRRLILLCLLVTPVVMFCINLLYSGSLDDQQNGFQLITLIISAPIIFLNAWEWQQPESLDKLIPPDLKIKSANPLRIDFSAWVVLAVSGGVVILWMGLIVFGLVRKPVASTNEAAPGPTLDISVIQTAAVETALAYTGPTPAETVRPLVTDNPAQTPNPLSTLDVKVTNTPEPDTIILKPIETATEVGAPTEIPALITLAGSGNKVVDFQKWDGPAIVDVVYFGTGSFIVTINSSPNSSTQQLINKTGPYNGTIPIDFTTSEYSSQFGITASGSWKFQIIRPASGRIETIPATISGSGDDVIMLTGGTPDQLSLDASQASGIFVVHGFRSGIWDLVSQETAPYTGTLPAAAGTIVLQISATGPWSIAVTAK